MDGHSALGSDASSSSFSCDLPGMRGACIAFFSNRAYFLDLQFFKQCFTLPFAFMYSFYPPLQIL